MAQVLPEMAVFFEDPDLSGTQLLSHHSRNCRACCMTAVCDDIWKKFACEYEETYPTPPMSPTASPAEMQSDGEDGEPLGLLDTSALAVLPIADQQLEYIHTIDQDLHSKLIQDCMWGSQSSSSGQQTPPTPSLSDSDTDYQVSVNPSAVLPQWRRTYKRSYSSSQVESDEEEIDVVTVESKIKMPEKRVSHSVPETPVSSPLKKKQRLLVSCPPSPAGSIGSTSSSSSAASFNARSIGSRSSTSSSSSKCRRSSYHQRRRVSRIETERRASHNVLERKRRNDLKLYFNVLRADVPDLEHNEKAPKVLILQKAACFIQQIIELDAKLMEQKFEEQRKRDQLLCKLQKLKDCCI